MVFTVVGGWKRQDVEIQTSSLYLHPSISTLGGVPRHSSPVKRKRGPRNTKTVS